MIVIAILSTPPAWDEIKALGGDMRDPRTYGENSFQSRFMFPNGYGASVVKHGFSYGSGQGLYELAVLQSTDIGSPDICYSTPVTDDVLGWLQPEEVEKIVEEIFNLDAPSSVLE